MRISIGALLLSLIFTIIGIELANSKNRNPIVWGILSFFFGLIALLILVLAERKPLIKEQENYIDFGAGNNLTSKDKDAISLEMREKDMEQADINYDIGFEEETTQSIRKSRLKSLGLFMFMLVAIGVVIALLIITSQ